MSLAAYHTYIRQKFAITYRQHPEKVQKEASDCLQRIRQKKEEVFSREWGPSEAREFRICLLDQVKIFAEGCTPDQELGGHFVSFFETKLLKNANCRTKEQFLKVNDTLIDGSGFTLLLKKIEKGCFKILKHFSYTHHFKTSFHEFIIERPPTFSLSKLAIFFDPITDDHVKFEFPHHTLIFLGSIHAKTIQIAGNRVFFFSEVAAENTDALVTGLEIFKLSEQFTASKNEILACRERKDFNGIFLKLFEVTRHILHQEPRFHDLANLWKHRKNLSESAIKESIDDCSHTLPMQLLGINVNLPLPKSRSSS